MAAFIEIAKNPSAKADDEGIRLALAMGHREPETLARLGKISAGADQAFVFSQVPSSATVWRHASGWCSSR